MKMMCGHFGAPDDLDSTQVDMVKSEPQIIPTAAQTPIVGAQSLYDDAPDASAESKGMEYGIMNRLYNREPSMVMDTGDQLESEVRAELAAWADDDSGDFYFAEQMDSGNNMDSASQSKAEMDTASMKKVTLSDVAQAREAQAQKAAAPNKVLVYGGIAALAAFFIFRE